MLFFTAFSLLGSQLSSLINMNLISIVNGITTSFFDKVSSMKNAIPNKRDISLLYMQENSVRKIYAF